MTGSILWEIRRCEERGGFTERLARVEGGFQYERIAGENDQEVFPDLQPAPFADLETALAALPGLLALTFDDQVTVCGLPDETIVEHLVVEHDDGWLEFDLDGRGWVWRGSVALLIDAAPFDSWSNGDDYGAPGGDRTSLLYRFGSYYVVDQADRGIDKLGHHASSEEAREEWVRQTIPGGWETYHAQHAYDEDEDEEW
jgi:hypothetical protein